MDVPSNPLKRLGPTNNLISGDVIGVDDCLVEEGTYLDISVQTA